MTSTPAETQRITVMAVHAHPDDETLWTGLALAKARRLGHDVSVVTCTLGEEGEVIGEKYQALVDAQQYEHGTGMLGGYRIAELQRALSALGVQHGPNLLGGCGAWRDSGMEGSESIRHPRAFAHEGEAAQDLLELQVEQLIEQIQRVRPEVILTYAADGGYGHPDHKRAHRIVHEAVRQLSGAGAEGAGADVFVPSQVLWCVTEDEKFAEGMQGLEEDPAAVPEGWTLPAAGEIATVPSAEVDLVIHGTAEDVAAKQAAMRAHATQIWVADGMASDVNDQVRDSNPPASTAITLFCLSNLITQPLLDSESYRLGWTAPGVPEDFFARALGEQPA
ncbi:N-acetyl-1-D-myo-inositol-2-amino-2-deoxy-alpha-D-glucopyranoside deacetylase [Corynebacterium sp. ACRQJ]|uniref:N-acetyl-1-D-myo-inositol-2-amino-2-deoxy-alpha- D-glucopyranoside deacetylase n=1 Tax=Corynebacterium sp. ACRQJ TaxID=2918189 RepID=UPI001EF4C8F9|nr:N-acetyl-1-D-myo-inositol-2-amino-2-deoxy-alpha-D-glucopyranoside deacetylase [Corynebacterium sp. ACRQJ]